MLQNLLIDILQMFTDQPILMGVLAAIAVLIIALAIAMIALSVKAHKMKASAKPAEEETPAPLAETAQNGEVQGEEITAEQVAEEQPAEEKPAEEKPVEEQPVEETKPEPEEQPAEQPTEEPATKPEEQPKEEPKAEPEEEPKAEEEAKAEPEQPEETTAEEPAEKESVDEAKEEPVDEEPTNDSKEENDMKKTEASQEKEPAAKKEPKSTSPYVFRPGNKDEEEKSEEAKSSVGGKWVIAKDERGRFDLYLYASNGEMMLKSGSPYSSLVSAKSGIKTYRDNIAAGRYEIDETKNGAFFVQIMNARGGLLATSADYKSKSACQSAAESIKRWSATTNVEVKEDEE